MRLLQLCKYYHPYRGGVELVSELLTRALQNEGHEVYIASFGSKSINRLGPASEQIFEYKVKEDLTVEYLSAKEIQKCDEKRALFFSQLITSMANANGGQIFIGISATRKLPRTLEPITNAEALNWLQLICSTRISPEIQNIQIEKITVSQQGDFIIGISIPNSFKAPHMSEDKRFYKRVGIRAELMEEYEIRDSYQKSKRPEIEIYSIVNTSGIPHLDGGKFEKVNFYPRFLIKNISSAIEKFYKVEVSIPSSIHNPNFDSLQDHFNRFEDGNTIFSIPQSNPLFQNEIATVAEGHFIVDANSYNDFENGELIIKIFYSSGVQTRHFNLKETFLYKNKQLEMEEFSQDKRILHSRQKDTPKLF